MPKNSAVVLALEPALDGTRTSQPIAGKQQKDVQLIHAFTSVKSKTL